MRRESSFNTLFNHWLKNVWRQTGAYELKQTQTDSLPFSTVVDHQLLALQNVQDGVFIFKIPDAGYQNPFDSFCLTEQMAYIVINYPAGFVLITINNFLYEKEHSKRKSLTWDRACGIATIIVAKKPR